MTVTAPRKFVFETVFDQTGAVTARAPQIKRMFAASEVDQIRREAFAEGERSALVVAEASTAQALAEIARHCQVALTALAKAAHDHREGSTNLALATGRKIADAALDRFPEAPVAAALVELAREIESQPVLKVQVASGQAETLRPVLDRAAQACGFAGSIVVGEDAALPRAAFLLDWGEGRAAFDPEAAATRVAAALETALAAEGLHAEPLISTDEVDHG